MGKDVCNGRLLKQNSSLEKKDPHCKCYSSEGRGILAVRSQEIPPARKGKVSQQKCYSSVYSLTVTILGIVSPGKCYIPYSRNGFPNVSITTLLQQGRASPGRLLQPCSALLWRSTTVLLSFHVYQFCSSKWKFPQPKCYDSALVHLCSSSAPLQLKKVVKRFMGR